MPGLAGDDARDRHRGSATWALRSLFNGTVMRGVRTGVRHQIHLYSGSLSYLTRTRAAVRPNSGAERMHPVVATGARVFHDARSGAQARQVPDREALHVERRQHRDDPLLRADRPARPAAAHAKRPAAVRPGRSARACVHSPVARARLLARRDPRPAAAGQTEGLVPAGSRHRERRASRTSAPSCATCGKWNRCSPRRCRAVRARTSPSARSSMRSTCSALRRDVRARSAIDLGKPKRTSLAPTLERSGAGDVAPS